MRKNLLSICAAALALALILTCLPLTVLAKTSAPRRTVPAGYNAHDFNKCAAFLEQTDGSGVKNGAKLSANYDPNDPATWGTYEGYDENGDHGEFPRFQWIAEGGELRIARIDVYCRDYNSPWQLFGTLDAGDCAALAYLDCSGCALTALNAAGCAALRTLYCSYSGLTALNVSGCAALRILDCAGNDLTALDVAGCAALEDLNCNYNLLTALDVSNSAGLKSLKCNGNALARLDLSHDPELTALYCSNGTLTALDLSHNPQLSTVYCQNDPLRSIILPDSSLLPVRRLSAEGNGCIGCSFTRSAGFNAYAYPGEDADFIGWYDETGAYVSDEEQLHVVSDSFSELTARFEGGILPGDADGNGEVDIADALLTLRCAMGLLGFDEGQTAACDLDGDGVITIADALIIMRTAMGLA